VPNEIIQVAYKGRQRDVVAFFIQRTAVSASVPGEDGKVRKVQFIGKMRDPARMFVAAV